MARVIGLSGPQGGGKTTLLNGLKKKGLAIDDFKVSRQVQAELGWDSLENATKNIGTMIAFQEKIQSVKHARDKQNQARTDVDIILTERTFADIACYTQLWTWELVHAGAWTVQEGIAFALPFVEECMQLQLLYDGVIHLPSMPHVQWQTDPHRAKFEHVSYITEQLDSFFDRKQPKSVPVFRVTEGSVEGRINQTYNWIKTL